MTQIRLILLISQLFLMVSCFTLAEANQSKDSPEMWDLFLNIEKRLSDNDIKRIDNRDQLVPYLHRIRFSEGLNAIVTLWVYGYREPVELSWWKSQYRSTRLLVLCLYYGRYIDRDVSLFPPFKKYAEKFSKEEKMQRLTEIDFVESNIATIRKRLGEKLLGSP